MIITRQTNKNKTEEFELSTNELAAAYKEYLIFKMKNEVLLWDLEFSENDAQIIAERAFERLERLSSKSRRECLDFEADRFRKEQATEKMGTMMYF